MAVISQLCVIQKWSLCRCAERLMLIIAVTVKCRNEKRTDEWKDSSVFYWKNALLECLFARQVVERAACFCYHDK